MKNWHKRGCLLTENGGAVKWDQKLRPRMVDTFDASAAGCSASAFEAAAYDYDPHEKGAAKKGAGGVCMRNFARTPAMTFVDEGLEAEYTLWQARQRWQVRANTLFMAPVVGIVFVSLLAVVLLSGCAV